jgi:hypothetical protein
LTILVLFSNRLAFPRGNEAFFQTVSAPNQTVPEISQPLGISSQDGLVHKQKAGSGGCGFPGGFAAAAVAVAGERLPRFRIQCPGIANVAAGLRGGRGAMP